MEVFAFFNEREAECFEHEATLSQTDLEKLNVPEDMPEMERAEYLLKNGLDTQKLSVLASLPQLLANNNSKTNFSIVLECIRILWNKLEGEMNSNVNAVILLQIFRSLSDLACSTVDGKVLEVPTMSLHDEFSTKLDDYNGQRQHGVFLISDEQIVKQLVPLTLDLVMETQQKEYATAASMAITSSLPRLSTTLKKTQIIRVALDKGDVSQTPGARLVCCLILGAVTALNLLAAPDIEGLFFQKMMALCQDTDAEVRKCMCVQLDALARSVSEEKACGELLPELLELLQDEEAQVKQAAFLTLVSLIDFFPSCERITHIVPEFQNIATELPDDLSLTFAEQLGVVVTKLAQLGELTNDNVHSIIQSFSVLCAHDNPQIRQYCAYNYPAMLKAFGGTYAAAMLEELLVKLASDTVEKVRLCIASGCHEVAHILGPQRAVRCLKPILVTLLRDESPIVLGTLLSRIPPLMISSYSVGDGDHKAALLDVVLTAIVQYHSVLPPSRNREQVAFVETLQHFQHWCSSEQMYEIVIPILFAFIEDSARPVQLIAMQTLVKAIRRNENASHRYALLTKIRTEYGRSRSCWRRRLFLDSCLFALEINSRQYCRLNFLDIAIDMLDDPIPNVRLKAVTLLPQWKNVLIHLSDDKVLERIRQFLDECSIDPDRDVARTICDVKQQVESAEASPHRRSPADAEDKRRVSEEEAMGLVTDHEDVSGDSKWSSMLEYTLVVGKDGQVVRHARVKSLDLVNKLSGRQPLRESTRGPTASNAGTANMGTNTALVTPSSNTGASSAMTASARGDSTRAKLLPKTPSKSIGSSGTTLPTCASARPPNAQSTMAKMPQGIKVAGSTGKLTTSTNKTTAAALRMGSSSTKDSSALTKIPIIRPSAPAKRESSPSGGTKPNSNGTLLTPPGSSSMTSGLDGQRSAAIVKSKSTAIDTLSSGALRAKVSAPTAIKR